MKKRFLSSIFMLMCLFTLAACGGGDSSEPTPDESSGTDWDQMRWNQNNWS